MWPTRLGVSHAFAFCLLDPHVHVQFGFDKVCNEERFQWALAKKELILRVCDDPLAERWWMTADSAFCALSACFEIGNAYRHAPGVAEYCCRLPVGQDGSCNGLQHYAAMLRDETMARHVNVAAQRQRGDVYEAVRQCASQLVEADLHSANPRHAQLAQMLHGKITRKIVKQTVMTSVYGVTSYGAKKQMMRWLSEAAEAGHLRLCVDGQAVQEHSAEGDQLLRSLATYLSKYTLYGIGQTNQSAYLSMLWLKHCAHKIASSGFRLSWCTPILGLPCTQHYAQRTKIVQTKTQSIQVKDYSQGQGQGQSSVIDGGKQTAAFPPNFVLSLDSTHCLLTARECAHSHSLTFASIHDSFWTHPCDVDTMSEVLRAQFVRLHEGELLQSLYATFCAKYPDISFAPPPRQASFDLQQVQDSEFFFS